MAGIITRAPIALGALLALVLPVDGRSQAPAVIEGTVSLGELPERRTASRYPTGGASVSGVQQVPAVVYLVGETLPADPVATVVEVAQRDTAFAPAAVAIQTGTVVRFPNGDPFFHNVFSYASNARFDLGRYPEGEAREHIFDEAGIARVFCEVHEFMRAVVVVTDHAFSAVIDEQGAFRLEGVPPGEYTIRAYQPDLGTVEQRVAVPAGGTAAVDLRLGG